MAIVTITGNIRGFDGLGAANVSLFFRVNNEIKTDFPTRDFGRQEIKTDVSGDFSIDLQQGLLYVVRIPAIDLERTLTAPAEVTRDLFEFWKQEDDDFFFFGIPNP